MIFGLSCPNNECSHSTLLHDKVSDDPARYLCVALGCDCGKGQGMFAAVGTKPLLPMAAAAEFAMAL